MVRRSVFDRIFQEMQEIRHRLDDIESSFSKWNPPPLEIPESELLSLPDHLRKTYMIVASEGECSAHDAAILTGRCRAMESNYLNQLVRMGWLTRRRDSRMVYFRIVSQQMLDQTTMAKWNHFHPRR
jgi:hypothetical protein